MERQNLDSYIEKTFIEINNDESISQKIQKAAAVKPSKRQLEWQKLELTAFIHFGMNTFSDLEWGDGTASPELFNPTELNPKQWVRILKDAGFKGLILTCKHHDGFCLWPSKYTDYSVKKSPFKNGNGDVVRMVSDACKEAGMKFGVYLSPWDRHDPRYGDSPEYNKYFLNQLTELLTEYGDIYEVWFDGACAEGPNGKRQEYDWNAYYSLVRDLQPNAVISIEGPDVRWVGNEAGKGRNEEWSVVPGNVLNGEKSLIRLSADATAQDLASDNALMNLPEDCNCLYWSPAQVDTSIRPGWFYHTWEDGKVKSLYDLVEIYDSSVGANASLLLNLPPNTEGKISAFDEKRLAEFGNYLKKSYQNNYVQNIETQVSEELYTLSIDLGESRECNCLILGENIANGQKVNSFAVKADINGELTEIACGKTIGYKKIVKLPQINTSRIVVEINGFRDMPEISITEVYNRENLICPPRITRDLNGNVQIIGADNYQSFYSIDGSEMQVYTKPFLMENSGNIVAFTGDKTKSGDDFVTSNRQLGILKKKWNVCESEANSPELLRYVKGEIPYICLAGLPNKVVIDLGETVTPKGIEYLPIDSPLDFLYNVYEIEVAVSCDNKSYETVFKGKLDNIKNNPVSRYLEFTKALDCRYISFTAISGFDANTAGIGTIELVV